MKNKQELEMIKPIVRVGNSAGVLLPISWLNGKARVELVEKPLDLNAEIFEIISDYLGEVLGVYLVGSYARGEETRESDVDVLAITAKTNKTIKSGKYEIMLVSKDELEKQIKSNALPLLPMIKEAKVIINSSLIEEYRGIEINAKNLKFHIETTKSALKVVKKMLEFDEREGGVSRNPVYSLILRIRETYIVDCLRKGEVATTKGLLELIDGLGVRREAYEVYLKVKNNKLGGCGVRDKEAIVLYEYLSNKIKEQEKWAKERSS